MYNQPSLGTSGPLASFPLASYPSLEVLDLTWTGLAGPFPASWENATNSTSAPRKLKQLMLNGNQLVGTVPPWLNRLFPAAASPLVGGMPLLLELHNNNLTGAAAGGGGRLQAK